jgi:acyl carrier protein
MVPVIEVFIAKELAQRPDLLPMKSDLNLLESGILDSLSIMRLVLFLEQQFGVKVSPEEVVPKNFRSIDSICAYLLAKRKS